jgi:hypothetical protein
MGVLFGGGVVRGGRDSNGLHIKKERSFFFVVVKPCRERVRVSVALAKINAGSLAFLRFVHFRRTYADSLAWMWGFTRKATVQRDAGCVMLGLLVSEFVNMVEMRFGTAVADAVLFGTDVPDDHDHDGLDHYPAAQLRVLCESLSRRVGQAPHRLLQTLAGRVVWRIRLVHPDLFARHADLFGQIAVSGEDVVLCAYEIDESETEEIELLFGERAAAQILVSGLLSDLARYDRMAVPARRHRTRASLTPVRAIFR